MSLSVFFAQLLNGLQYGLLLFLIASGLTLIFGVLGVINLAHGSMFMIGAYTAYWVAKTTETFFLRSTFSHSRIRAAKAGLSR